MIWWHSSVLNCLAVKVWFCECSLKFGFCVHSVGKRRSAFQECVLELISPFRHINDYGCEFNPRITGAWINISHVTQHTSLPVIKAAQSLLLMWLMIRSDPKLVLHRESCQSQFVFLRHSTSLHQHRGVVGLISFSTWSSNTAVQTLNIVLVYVRGLRAELLLYFLNVHFKFPQTPPIQTKPTQKQSQNTETLIRLIIVGLINVLPLWSSFCHL